MDDNENMELNEEVEATEVTDNEDGSNGLGILLATVILFLVFGLGFLAKWAFDKIKARIEKAKDDKFNEELARRRAKQAAYDAVRENSCPVGNDEEDYEET